MTTEGCEFIKDHFSQYLEGCLEEDARLLFEGHLNACSGCRKLLDEQRRLGCLLRAIRFDLPDTQAIEELPLSAGNRELTDIELDMAAGGIVPDSPVCPFCGCKLSGGNCLCSPDKKK